MHSCTEKEASTFGRFLNIMMGDVYKLRKDEKKFSEIAKENVCFRRHYFLSQPMTYDELQKGHTKWEMRMFRAVKPGLNSEDWSERRNSLLVISKTYESFPLVWKVFQATKQLIEKIASEDKRPDIKLLANSLATRMKVVQSKDALVEMPKAGAPKPG